MGYLAGVVWGTVRGAERPPQRPSALRRGGFAPGGTWSNVVPVRAVLVARLARPPEGFLAQRKAVAGETALPTAGPDHRLRWNMNQLFAALNEARRYRQLTWAALADQLACTTSRLTPSERDAARGAGIGRV